MTYLSYFSCWGKHHSKRSAWHWAPTSGHSHGLYADWWDPCHLAYLATKARRNFPGPTFGGCPFLCIFWYYCKHFGYCLRVFFHADFSFSPPVTASWRVGINGSFHSVAGRSDIPLGTTIPWEKYLQSYAWFVQHESLASKNEDITWYHYQHNGSIWARK